MKQLARIIKDCGHRGKVGHIYEVIEKNPRDGFRLIMPGQNQFTFWYPEDCVEQVEPGACTVPAWAEKVKALEEITTGLNIDKWKVPKDADFAWHLDKVTKSITDLLKEKNAAYGNTALNPLGIFSKLGAAEAIKARIDDKLARISNKGLNDDTEDTARDLVGYLLLLLMAIDRD
tara:strand:+ start:2479 stop:3003 length:525 start_codon:yes stop_codon:yes gene_type:complete